MKVASGLASVMGAAGMKVYNVQNEPADSVETASKIANISPRELYALIGDGSLPARKRGRRTLIFMSDLQELMHNLPVETASKIVDISPRELYALIGDGSLPARKCRQVPDSSLRSSSAAPKFCR
jgi:excisionase family DNA binding protein